MRGRSFRHGLFILCLLLIAVPVHARKKRSLPKWEWGLSASAAFMYDDNVLGFSEYDRNRFRRDPDSFPTPLKSMDDLESSVTIKPSLQWRAPLQLMITGDYRLKAVHRLSNGFSDYQTHNAGVSVRPRIIGYSWLARARILAIPSFYLRNYRDRDYREYYATQYAQWDYSAALRFRVAAQLWLEGGVSYGTYYYNRKFTEYDSEYWDYSLGGFYEAPYEVQFNASYTRRLSENVGKNQRNALLSGSDSTSMIEDTEYGDADYHEDDITVGITVPAIWIKVVSTDASLSYRHRRRVYTTERSLSDDPFHRGRLDNRGQWTVSVRMRPARLWDIDGYFAYESRTSDSDVSSVPLAKNFIRREIGLVFTYRIR